MAEQTQAEQEPSGLYEQLKNALIGLSGIAFTEYEWDTRPAGNHGTVQLDFMANGDRGDDLHQDQAWEGSVDVWTNGRGDDIAAEVEGILETYCEGAWELNSIQADNRKLHREYTFQIEVI